MPTSTPPPPSLLSNGKIACLPKSVREELNRRLDDSERGPKILAWLNALRASGDQCMVAPLNCHVACC